METLAGKLLIAGPKLFDPNFRRGILLIGRHDEDGAMGVVLNRPGPVPVQDAAPPLAPLVPPGEPVFIGGPVQPEAAVVLAEFEEPARAPLLAFGAVGFLAGEEPDAVGGIRRARVFAGYAGWAPGQLEGEMDEEAWLTEPALPDDVFAPDPDQLWQRVVRRMGREFEILTTMPYDPSMN